MGWRFFNTNHFDMRSIVLTNAENLRNSSAQLAVFAAASIVTAEAGPFVVPFGLAGHAQVYAWHGFASRRGNLGVAGFAVEQARAFRRLTTCAFDRVANGGVDLILYGVVVCPARSHGAS